MHLDEVLWMEAWDGRVAIEVLDRISKDRGSGSNKDRGSGSKQGSRFWIEARIEVPDERLAGLAGLLTASDH